MDTNKTGIWNDGAGDDWSSMHLAGYKVEATDGDIGKVDEASNDAGAGYIVVDTGPWIFGKKVLLPAGVISRVDTTDEKVFVRPDEGGDQERPRVRQGHVQGPDLPRLRRRVLRVQQGSGCSRSAGDVARLTSTAGEPRSPQPDVRVGAPSVRGTILDFHAGHNFRRSAAGWG